MEDKIEVLVFSDKSAEIQCPSCNSTLMFCTMCDVKCVGCPNCRGLLIDGATFGQITQFLRSQYRGPIRIPTPPSEVALKMKRQCPACNAVLDTHPYYGPGNVVIDACRECELVWLDQKELAQIVMAPGRR